MLLYLGNRMEDETSNLSFSNELNLSPGATNIAADNTANVSESGEPDKCVCGADKLKTDNRATKCSNCRQAICVVKGRKVTSQRTDKVAIHKKNSHRSGA